MCMCMCMPFFGKLTTNSLAQHWARPLDGLRIQQKLAPKNYPDPLPAPPPSPSPICAFHSVRSLPLGAHPALRPRPPPLPWLAWVATPHHHAPSGREVDGALSRPSPRRNGAPNTCPDYCAFPGCSLSVREGSVRVVLSSIPRPPPPSPPLCLALQPYHHREAARRNQTRSRDPRLAPVPFWTGWPATTTPGIATRRFPPAVILSTTETSRGVTSVIKEFTEPTSQLALPKCCRFWSPLLHRGTHLPVTHCRRTARGGRQSR